MNTNKTQKTNTNEDFYEISREELLKIFSKYHPMENNSSFKLDNDYIKRFEKVFGARTK